MTKLLQFTRDLMPSSLGSGEALTDLSLFDLRARLRSRKLTPSALTLAHIERIIAVNPALNAVIEDRFATARAEARAADELLAKTADFDSLPPLFGIPCTIKEFFAVCGMPQTGGLVRREHSRAACDSTVVERLRKAGAIVLGTTNVPEGGLWMETHNLLYGRTNNPWNLSRTCGGSSGGEGAIVAAGGAPFGIGSDIGGSIRLPAAFCGTVGHKPSGGLVPLTDHFPPALGESQFLVGGPLCRRVGDVLPILRVIAGPDGKDHTCAELSIGDPATVDLTKVKVFPVPAPLRTSAVMREAVTSAATALADLGTRLGTLDAERFSGGFVLWMAAMTTAAGSLTYGDVLADSGNISVAKELLRLPLNRSQYILPSLVTVAFEKLLKILPRSFSDMTSTLHRLERLRAELDELLGDNGVLIYPPYSRPAPRHRAALLTPFDAACTALWNILGYPATVVPLGFDRDGMPVAVQVIARRGLDHLTIAVAAALEKRFGGWVRAEPPPVRARQAKKRPRASGLSATAL